MLLSVLVSICNNEKEMSEVCKIMLWESHGLDRKKVCIFREKNNTTIRGLLRSLHCSERHVKVANGCLFCCQIW